MEFDFTTIGKKMLKMFSVLKNFLKSNYMKIQNGPKSCINQTDSELQHISWKVTYGKDQ